MDANQKISTLEMKLKLLALWALVLFTIYFFDFHHVVTPGTIEEIQSGVVNGYELTEIMLFIAALVHIIPVLMVYLPLVLTPHVSKWVNIIAAALYIFFNVTDGPTDLDHILFRTVIVIALIKVIWYAWKLPQEHKALAKGN